MSRPRLLIVLDTIKEVSIKTITPKINECLQTNCALSKTHDDGACRRTKNSVYDQSDVSVMQ